MYSSTIVTAVLASMAVTAVQGLALPLFERAPAACKTHLVRPAPTNYICGTPLHLHYLSEPSASNVKDPSPLIAHTPDLDLTSCMSSCFNDTRCISFGFKAAEHSPLSALKTALQQNDAGEVHAGRVKHGHSVCWTFHKSLRTIGFTKVSDLHTVVGADTESKDPLPHYWNRHCWEATGDACAASSAPAPAPAAPAPATSSTTVVALPAPAPVTSVVVAPAPTSTAVDATASVTAVTSYTGTTTIIVTSYVTNTIFETTATVAAVM